MIVPERPSELGILTRDGKDAWWPGQREIIQKIVDAYRDKRFVFLQAPTGSGKTIIAAAVQRMLDMSSVILTHTIPLQKQYLLTLPQATVVTGRRNHKCELPFAGGLVMADVAPCAYGDPCEYQRADGCSYYRMLYEAAANTQTVLNYAYATRILQQPFIRAGRNPFHRDFLVCDEGDLAEQALVDAARIVVRTGSWQGEGWSLPTSRTVDGFIRWAHEMRRQVALSLEEARLDAQERTPDSIKRWGRLRSMMRTVEDLIAIRRSGEWIVALDPSGYAVRPLWGWEVAREMLWGPFERVLIMSATLGDPKDLACKLGIPEDESIYFEERSRFPIANRPLFYWPVVKVSRKTGAEDWDRMASAIRSLADQPVLRERKGIIHTGSFTVMDELAKRLDNGRFVAQGRGLAAREQIIEQLRRVDAPLVYLSPSLATGLDVPYEIAFQVIAKVPFGDLGDTVVRARKETVLDGVPFGRLNYDAEAANTVVQAYGRAVRAPDDAGITYVVDGNWWPLYKRAYHPQFFKEAVRWMKT